MLFLESLRIIIGLQKMCFQQVYIGTLQNIFCFLKLVKCSAPECTNCTVNQSINQSIGVNRMR